MSLCDLWKILSVALFLTGCHLWGEPPLPSDDTAGTGTGSSTEHGKGDTASGDSDSGSTTDDTASETTDTGSESSDTGSDSDDTESHGTGGTDSDSNSETGTTCEDACSNLCCGEQCCEKPDDVCYEGACCTPTTCEVEGRSCGDIPDGCGGTLVCGTCEAPEYCTEAGQCVDDCAGRVCGRSPVKDFDCGTCPSNTPYCDDGGQCLECIALDDDNCGAFLCDVSNSVCYSTCSSSAQCAAGNYCDGASCALQKLDGEACGSAGECKSGICNNTCGCVPDCEGRQCGADGCGGTCEPGCSGVFGCDEEKGTCVQCHGEADFTFCSVVTEPNYGYDICMDEKCISPGTCGDSVECNATGVYYEIPPDEVPTSQYLLTAGDEPVVHDSVTGIVWQGCSAGQEGSDCATGAAAEYTWQQALEYCDGLLWGGYDDWYLPNENELLSIVDSGRRWPVVDETVFPGTKLDDYWSSSVWAKGRSYIVNFENGWALSSNKGDTHYARCARRGASAATPPRFKRSEPVLGEPVVEDNVTGLTWQGCTSGQSGADCSSGTAGEYDWQEAFDYCQGLVWGGYDDWALPGFKELRSIVDNRRSAPPIEETVFPNTTVYYGQYWTASGVVGLDSAWFVFFANSGDVDFMSKRISGESRCVRRGS